MNPYERRRRYKKKKAQRNLEARLIYYAHNNIVMQLGIIEYLHRFCKDNKGEIHYDPYIRGFVQRYEDRQRELAE